MKKTAPFGTWKSPITSDLIVAKTVGLGGPGVDGDDFYWVESRPSEAGRNVIVRLRTKPNQQIAELNPAPTNARTRVHEYGGGAVLASSGQVFYTNFKDQQIYQVIGGRQQPITQTPDLRYADYVADWQRGNLIAVREDHRDADLAAGRQCVNCIVAVPIDNYGHHNGSTRSERVLVSGNDFYSSPRLSPDGTQLAWLTWNHPNMPWDGCELWVADIDEAGQLINHRLVAGSQTESICQPEWSPDGMLYFVAEYTGWWNLYRWSSATKQREPLTQLEAEFGVPMWVFGQSTYGFVSLNQILCTFSQRGESQLALLNTDTLTLRYIDTPYTSISNIYAIEDQAVFSAASPTTFGVIVRLEMDGLKFTELKRSSDLDLKQFDGYLSVPQAIEFPTENGLTAHAFYYPPVNKDFIGPNGELPPVLVKSHGGPTSASSSRLKLEYQYWTSRGIGVLDVNYGGSIGYGRDYRQRLNGNWGIVDMDDCVNAAKYLAEQDVIDGNRLMISGGSAGGYTTLCALTFRNVFKAGASYYGVSDAEALAKDTHKFESRYLDSLIGPYPARKDIYIERSPIHFADRISAPVLFLQGLEDEVVPPSQSEAMFKAIRQNEIPTAYLTFEGEQHGFRKAENIKRALEAEFYFYSKVFGYDPADKIEPVEIENL